MNNTTENTLVTVFMAPKVLILNQMETRMHIHLHYMKVCFPT